ncbi:MAG: ABC transporter permease, partial [Candidatus Micrarchaeota archaeon]|nr:ABC transporter permease [Candidatus Micrarchaeota archaeon]
MELAEAIRYSINSLRQRKMRSWLTIIGIVIGIASVVALLDIGEGFNKAVNDQLSVLGGNTVFITPAARVNVGSAAFSGRPPASSGKLYQNDVERVKRIPEVTDVARLIMGRTNVKYKDKEISATVSGIEPGVFEKTTAIEIAEGRFLLESDRKVAVVGDSVANSLFGQKNRVQVNSYLEIGGEKYRVVGVLKKSGGGFGPSSRTDSGIFIMFEDARGLLKDTYASNEIGAMVLRTREGSDTQEVVEKIKAELDASRKVKPEERDYSVVDPKSIQQAIGNILSLITLFLGAIAGISLVVGGLAIASNMFTSVIERTKEIGILKAIGATEEDIRNIFLFES